MSNTVINTVFIIIIKKTYKLNTYTLKKYEKKHVVQCIKIKQKITTDRFKKKI